MIAECVFGRRAGRGYGGEDRAAWTFGLCSVFVLAAAGSCELRVGARCSFGQARVRPWRRWRRGIMDVDYYTRTSLSAQDTNEAARSRALQAAVSPPFLLSFPGSNMARTIRANALEKLARLSAQQHPSAVSAPEQDLQRLYKRCPGAAASAQNGTASPGVSMVRGWPMYDAIHQSLV